MKIQPNLSTKMIFAVFMIFLVIFLLYRHTYLINVSVVREEIQRSNVNQLEFFLSQMENQIDQLAISAYTLERDPSIQDYRNISHLDHLLDANKLRITILEKLTLQSASSSWSNQMRLHFPLTSETISTAPSLDSDYRQVMGQNPGSWTYSKHGQPEQGEFVFLIAAPQRGKTPVQHPNLVIETRFQDENIRKMLDQFKRAGGDPFLFHQQNGTIVNQTSQAEFTNEVASKLKEQSLSSNGSQLILIHGQQYFVNYVQSKSLGWYLVDYVPLERVLAPIKEGRNFFIASTVMLLILGIVLSAMLYRNIQRPISLFIRVMNKFKQGDLTARVRPIRTYEFRLLYTGFNEMADRIQELIERVYLEQIRSQDAVMKQLQSQINPHFLYNCLFFIKSKASVGDTESIKSMALSLGEYYRYLTRVDTSQTTLGQELKLVIHYLNIQNLRKQRIHHVIEIPDPLLELQIPKLLIQPLVENSIIHGIEPKVGSGLIRICAELSGRWLTIRIEDDGVGMEPQQLQLLRDSLLAPAPKSSGYGLWNVHQRTLLHFGQGSGLQVSESAAGGIRFILNIQIQD
ncbi:MULTISPECIES: cache domain-containing sensor histidine kinase [Paenibacillus]|uniref:cache domain-containing sensor histidine kinase n=1 Tax=Paenibacillus TaxID=44249 RepID=UPI0022B8DBE9|nr:histidine kinase [Paenibacillus caseinilyticus]